MKRFFYLSLAVLVSLTIMCCENTINGSVDIPITPPATEPDEPETPTAPSTPVDDSKAALSSLTISAGSLNPAFSPDTLEYTASVNTSFATLTLTGKAAYEKARLDANNGKALNLVDGINVLTYKVIAEDGSASRTYKITVTREKDTTPPVIVSSTVSVSRVDTSKAGATVTGTFVAEDPSGMGTIANFMFYALNGSGPTAKVTKNEAQSTVNRGVYDWTVTIPQFSTLGDYALYNSSLKLADSLGNVAQETQIVFPRDAANKFSVYTSDSSAPRCDETSQENNRIYGASTITGSVTLSDPSGCIEASHFVFTSSQGSASPSVTKNTKFSTATKAVYNWSVNIPGGRQSTTYYLTFDAQDRYGNETSYRECSIDYVY